jgi:tetratricopeptide (TPR) repeat protein
MSEFSAVDFADNSYQYRHGNSRALMVAFLSARQKQSVRAAAEIVKVVKMVPDDADGLEVVAVIYDANAGVPFGAPEKEPVSGFHLLKDAERKLWGKFGIIALPTVIVAGKDDKVLWVEPGHAYNFAPVLEARLKQALGIAQSLDPNLAGKVKAVEHNTAAARVKRHLEMAQVLLQKGRISAAISQVRQARELDPNSTELALELAQLLCRAGDPNAALDVVDKVEAAERAHRAKVALIAGWARRQLGKLEGAEKLLVEATKLNPRSSRAFFELGKLYHAEQLHDKAMQAYYRALALVFSEPLMPEFSRQREKQSSATPKSRKTATR